MFLLNDPRSYQEWAEISSQRLSQAIILNNSGHKIISLYLACHGLEAALKGYILSSLGQAHIPSTHDIERLRILANDVVPIRVFQSEAAKIFYIHNSRRINDYTILRYQSDEACLPQIDGGKFISEIASVCIIASRKARAKSKRRNR